MPIGTGERLGVLAEIPIIYKEREKTCKLLASMAYDNKGWIGGAMEEREVIPGVSQGRLRPRKKTWSSVGSQRLYSAGKKGYFLLWWPPSEGVCPEKPSSSNGLRGRGGNCKTWKCDF